MAGFTDEVIEELGYAGVIDKLIRHAERQRDAHDPNATGEDADRKRAVHLAYRQDIETLQSARQRLRH